MGLRGRSKCVGVSTSSWYLTSLPMRETIYRSQGAWSALLAHTKHRCLDTHGCTRRPNCSELMWHKLLLQGALVPCGLSYPARLQLLEALHYYPSQTTRQLAMKHTVAFYICPDSWPSSLLRHWAMLPST